LSWVLLRHAGAWHDRRLQKSSKHDLAEEETEMDKINGPLKRAAAFCARFGMQVPILAAPMAGACPARLAIAVANAGGMGAMGALLSTPAEIAAWAAEFRAASDGAFQLNLWVPDPPPKRDAAHEADIRAFLSKWGPEVPEAAGDARPPDFLAQCEAILAARPTVISSIMGLFPAAFVAALKERGIAWFACATTLAEARAAEAAGADAIVVQGQRRVAIGARLMRSRPSVTPLDCSRSCHASLPTCRFR
jgi:nitronate monooxygenase